MVIVLVCDNCVLPQKDEAIVHDTIERIITKTKKGFIAWLKAGKLAVDADVLVQLMNPTSAEPQRNPQTTGVSRSFEKSTTYLDQPQGYQMRNPSEWETRREGNEQSHTQKPPPQPHGAASIQLRYPPATTTSYTGYNKPNREPVMLKSKLRRGIISYVQGDLEILRPGFEVPDRIIQSLLNEHYITAEAEVKIVKDSNGELRVTVEHKSKDSSKDQGIELAANEAIMLETRLRYGKASFEKKDLRFIRENFQIPPYITTSLKRDYETMPNVELYVISDDKGNLRYKVQLDVVDKACGRVTKVWRRITNYKS